MTVPFSRRSALGCGAALFAAVVLSAAVVHADPLKLAFVTHAKFFSTEVGLPKVIDPQVFVADAKAPDAGGPQGIHHIAGFRPATVDDAASSATFTAQGKPLGFTLGFWFGATGSATLEPQADGKVKITADFVGLVPNGVYDLFENHFDQSPIGFTPLDGTATTNAVTVGHDGTAHVVLIAPQALTHANAILLVYHSDNMRHGAMRGEIGVNAHHHLIVRIPQ